MPRRIAGGDDGAAPPPAGPPASADMAVEPPSLQPMSPPRVGAAAKAASLRKSSRRCSSVLRVVSNLSARSTPRRSSRIEQRASRSRERRASRLPVAIEISAESCMGQSRSSDCLTVLAPQYHRSLATRLRLRRDLSLHAVGALGSWNPRSCVVSEQLLHAVIAACARLPSVTERSVQCVFVRLRP